MKCYTLLLPENVIMLFVAFLPYLASVCNWDNKTGFPKTTQVVVTVFLEW